MLILVGVTVTVAINGGLFEKTKEGAKGTTIERVKEQITADIVTKIADKEGEKITKNDFKQSPITNSVNMYPSNASPSHNLSQL